MTIAANIEALAAKLARDYVASGLDMGDLYNSDDYGTPTDAEWDAICDRAEAIAPSIRVTAAERQLWADADWAVTAEKEAESRYFGRTYA